MLNFYVIEVYKKSREKHIGILVSWVDFVHTVIKEHEMVVPKGVFGLVVWDGMGWNGMECYKCC